MAKKQPQPLQLTPPAGKLIFASCARPRPTKRWTKIYEFFGFIAGRSAQTELCYDTPRGLRTYRRSDSGMWTVPRKAGVSIKKKR